MGKQIKNKSVQIENQHPLSNTPPSAPVWLAMALIITVAARAIPDWYIMVKIWRNVFGGEISLPYAIFSNLVLLVVGACLALSSPRRSGLCLGTLRKNRWRVLLVCGLPILLTALVYPNLPERPFKNAAWGMWAISPLAQDLVFIGFLYGQFERVFPGTIHRRLPVNRALFITALYFAIWHLPNLAANISGAYVIFQLCYTATGLIFVGLSRQWTGSILYATLTHSMVNAIAWYTS